MKRICKAISGTLLLAVLAGLGLQLLVSEDIGTQVDGFMLLAVALAVLLSFFRGVKQWLVKWAAELIMGAVMSLIYVVVVWGPVWAWWEYGIVAKIVLIVYAMVFHVVLGAFVVLGQRLYGRCQTPDDAGPYGFGVRYR